MIKIKNLSLSYDGQSVLEDINIEIKEPGIYLLCGESGSGKTSLLNIIALMENRYKGEFYFDEEDICLKSEKEKAALRFNKITYLFQIPKLIENESIKTNLEISLGKKLSREKQREYLEKIHLKNINKKVSSLSGGEKQRVNILMGILRNTPIILGDEITSGLDEANKKIIMNILKKEAKSKIIILVSHDYEFTSKYARDIRKIENKTIKPLKRTRGYPLEKEKAKDNRLPFEYCFKHAFNTISNKKIRAIISIFSSSIALVCLGICLILTSSLKDSVMSSLGSVINENQIIMERKEESYYVNENISIEEKDINKIYGRYKEDISYIGVNYKTDIDAFFEDENYFAYVINDKQINVSSLKASTLESATMILPEERDLFYMSKETLQEEDLILTLSRGEVSRLCSLLNEEYHDDSSLLNALKKSSLELRMYLSNEEWNYHLEATFYMVGYTIDDERRVYHTTSSWNEYALEEVMQLVPSLNLSADDYYPWSVKKEYYLYVKKENINSLLTNILEDKSLNDYSAKCVKKGYDFGISFEYSHDNYLDVNLCNTIVNENSFLSSFIPCTTQGYSVASSVLIAGFNYPTFLSKDYELLEEYIDMNTYSEENLGIYQSTILSYTNKNILSLSLLDATKDNYCGLKTNKEAEIKLENPNQIMISRGLANKLGIEDSLVNNSLFFMMLKDISYANGKYKNNFEIINVKVVGIIEDDNTNIYVNYLWPIIFFMTNYEMNNQGIEKIILNYNSNNMVEDLALLNEKYQEFIFTNPYLEYASSIENIGNYLTVGLSIFSSFCLLSTLLMLIVSSNLFVSETKKEIGIYSLYGYQEKSIKVLYKVFAYIMSGYSLVISIICLVAVYFIISKGDYSISFSDRSALYLPIFVMIITSLAIGFISSRASTRHVFKQNPLLQLYEK